MRLCISFDDLFFHALFFVTIVSGISFKLQIVAGIYKNNRFLFVDFNIQPCCQTLINYKIVLVFRVFAVGGHIICE